MKRACLIAACLVAARVAAQPLGGEFRVNASTTGEQAAPVVALELDEFVAVWVSSPAGNAEIFAQRFDKDGPPRGPEFRVNTTTTAVQTAPDVAKSVEGRFVVVWQSGQYGNAAVFGQRYAASGAPLGGEFRVNTSTTVTALEPRVASDPAGNFVVVWDGHDGNGTGVAARRFSASGAPLGTEFLANSTTTGNQFSGSVSANGAGGFVVAWTSDELGSKDVFARRFDPAGAPLGSAFRVNTSTTGTQEYPHVSADASGNFLVAWENFDPVNSSEIRSRRFSSNGAALSGEVVVGIGYSPSTAALPGGGYVVTWQGVGASDVFARRELPSGAFASAEFRVNTTTSGFQIAAAAAADDRGLVVVWKNGNGSTSDISGQRYNLERIPGDVDGDGVVSVSDVFYLINFLFAGGPAPI